VSNGTYSASEQRLLSEEEELDRMMKELQETFPSAEGRQYALLQRFLLGCDDVRYRTLSVERVLFAL
jgi:hypothetical protein